MHFISYISRGLALYSHGRVYGDPRADMVAENPTYGSKGSRKKETLGLAYAFGTPKPALSDTLPPIMPYS